ncbi:MAG: hypothetical protein WKF37_19210 [Bryobacteraceae bacterium]
MQTLQFRRRCPRKPALVSKIGLSANLDAGILPRVDATVSKPCRRLTFSVQYMGKQPNWQPPSPRIPLGSVGDPVRDQYVIFDLAHSLDGKLFWGDPQLNYPIVPGAIRARIVVSDETGDEQYYYFMLASARDPFWRPYELLRENELWAGHDWPA